MILRHLLSYFSSNLQFPLITVCMSEVHFTHYTHSAKLGKMQFFEYPAWVMEWSCWSNVKVICGGYIVKNILHLRFPAI